MTLNENRFYALRRYSWGNNSVRAKYKGELCLVLAYGKKQSALVKFFDGFEMITSMRALRKEL